MPTDTYYLNPAKYTWAGLKMGTLMQPFLCMLKQIHDNATESITRLDKENRKVPKDLCVPPPMKVEINVAQLCLVVEMRRGSAAINLTFSLQHVAQCNYIS